VCDSAADCTAAPYGSCVVTDTDDLYGTYSCSCVYGCATDADCGAGEICACGGVGETARGGIRSRCVPATCQDTSSCGDEFCALDVYDWCDAGRTSVACTRPDDECTANRQCDADPGSPYSYCEEETGRRVCRYLDHEDYCGDGRPLRIAGRARVASAVPRDDWLAPRTAPRVDGLSLSERGELARAWTEAGLREHASVASFTGFLLDLLALGAPASLVAETTSALSDEVHHAQLCFAVASAFAGEPVGPGPLDATGARPGPRTLADAVRAAVREGCVDETVSAIDAAEACALASDPAIRSVLGRIAADEWRHARLAWSFVAWALAEGGPAIRAIVDEELRVVEMLREGVLSRDETVREVGISSLERWGRLDAETRRAVRARVAREVILPCADALRRAA
jgi:hypothetical protein